MEELLIHLVVDFIFRIVAKVLPLGQRRNVVDRFRIIQKFLSNYAEYYPWKRRTLGIGASTMRTW